MKYATRLFVSFWLLTFASISQGGVITVIEYEGSARAGDNTAAETTSFTLDSSAGGLPISANQTASDADSTAPGISLASTQGIAEITDEVAQFATRHAGRGAYSASSTTTVTQLITNSSAATATGTYRSLFNAGGGGFLTGSDFDLIDYDAGLSVNVDIELDGVSLFAMSVALNTDGTFSAVSTDFLNGFESTVGAQDFASVFAWDDSTLDLALGEFAAGQTKQLILTMTTQVFNNNACSEITNADCLFSTLSIGDPPDFGYGQAMLYSVYFDPTAIPVPGTAGLLLMGLGALWLTALHRRRVRA